MFTAVVATLAVNIAANVVSPANDFANAFPRFIDFKTGGLITGLLAILMQPWKLLADPSGYIFTWLLGYSGGLGSIAGVLIADYWIVRRTVVKLEDLYLADGRYRYAGGWNSAAVVATLAGCALAWGGLVVPVAEAALRLRVVRGLRGGVRRLRRDDAATRQLISVDGSRTRSSPRRPRRTRRPTIVFATIAIFASFYESCFVVPDSTARKLSPPALARSPPGRSSSSTC